ncbi:MAG: hypothetical protein LBT11_03160 [Treponema sp.]|nr:hypothetical protein [Treponema sp.]
MRLGLGLLLAGLGALLVSCNQDPVFYYVSQEQPPVDPLVSGHPSKMAGIGDDMYVANPRGIWKYSSSVWSVVSKPSGYVRDIAAAGDYLYALVENDASERLLYRQDMVTSPSTDWQPVSNGTSYELQSIFGVGTTSPVALFAGGRKQDTGDAAVYAVLYTDTTGNSLSPTAIVSSGTTTGDGLLLAAAYFESNYYISVTGGGIQYSSAASLASPTTVDDSADAGDFIAFAQVGSNLVATASNGTIWQIPNSGTPISKEEYAVVFTPALTVWKNSSSTETLLLIGRGNASSATYLFYGYYELPISAGGLDFTSDLLDPGDPGDEETSTITNDKQAAYDISLGIRSLTSIFQASDGTVFASTQQKGLWSLRSGTWSLRSGTWGIEPK